MHQLQRLEACLVRQMIRRMKVLQNLLHHFLDKSQLTLQLYLAELLCLLQILFRQLLRQHLVNYSEIVLNPAKQIHFLENQAQMQYLAQSP